jgi:hypothetical protein
MSIPQVPQQQAAPNSAPSQPQSNDEAIGGFARGFLAELDSADAAQDQQDRGEDPPVEQQEQALEIEAQPQELPEAETPTPDVPMVEVDVDGVKYHIPEQVKHRVMADKDYRQKTQEVAATRKHFEALTATAQKVFEQAQQLAPYNAQLFSLDNHAQYLDQQLRSGQLNDDPIAFNRAQGELAITLRNRDQLAAGLQQQQEKLTYEQDRLRMQAWQHDAPKLFEEFPELGKPEGAQKFARYAQDAGLPQEALSFLNFSAAGAKLVWKAHQFDQMVADQAKAKAKLKEKVKTLPAATQSSRAVDSGANDKQLQSDWAKNGGKVNDPAFTQILRNRIRRP